MPDASPSTPVRPHPLQMGAAPHMYEVCLSTRRKIRGWDNIQGNIYCFIALWASVQGLSHRLAAVSHPGHGCALHSPALIVAPARRAKTETHA